MMSPTMTSGLMDAADVLLRDPRSSSAFRRRAVSTAYYAVFHELAKLCADLVMPDIDPQSEEYVRVYRALDHGPLKSAFGVSPLKEVSTIRQIGNSVIRLQSARIKADYLPPDATLFPSDSVRSLLDQARETMARLNSLDQSERRLLASCLLFRNR